MKNIHILPTDKPSRLVYFNNKLLFAPNDGFIIADGKQHIYITSDEEIKEGDYGLGFALGIKGVGRGHYVFKQDGTNVGKLNAICNGSKKIILTTDPDLIKDGVQSIPEEFLEWLVKNPSCEFVEVQDWVNYYKVFIPQEEPKQCKTPLDCGKIYNEELTTQTITCTKCGNTHTFPFGGDYYCPSPKQEDYDKNYQPISLSEVDKQETLEEAGEKLYPTIHEQYQYDAFIEGAKWQAERMYSEEEVRQMLWQLGDALFNNCQDGIEEGEPETYFDDIIEQFKKK